MATPKAKSDAWTTGFRYRLEALPHHERRLKALAGGCRYLWNFFLHWREDAYLAARAAGGTLPKGAFGYNWMAKELTRLRAQIPWMSDADVVGQQQTLRDLEAAYRKFFEGDAGYPQPRKHGDDRFRVCGKQSFAVHEDWVRLPKVGWIRFRKSRDIPRGQIKNVSVSREGKHWFVSFCVEHKEQTMAAPAGAPIGLDLGVAQSVTASDGRVDQMPVPDDKESSFLRRLHRHVSRKQKGSRRRRLAVERLAKHKRHIAARVRDAAHKLTSRLATTRSEIHVEDLRLRNMTASARGDAAQPGRNVRAKAGLNRSLLANAHAQTVRFLEYKCQRTGAKLIFKNPAHTSQECAECHHIDPANRPSQAVFRCVKCGHTDNADVNAARVVLSRPADGRSVAVRRGKRKSARKGARPNEAQTHLRDQDLPPGSTGIPAKAALAA